MYQTIKKQHRIEPKNSECSTPSGRTHLLPAYIIRHTVRILRMCDVVARFFYSSCSFSCAFQLIRSGYLSHTVCVLYHIVNINSNLTLPIHVVFISGSHNDLPRKQKTNGKLVLVKIIIIIIRFLVHS